MPFPNYSMSWLWLWYIEVELCTGFLQQILSESTIPITIIYISGNRIAHPLRKRDRIQQLFGYRKINSHQERAFVRPRLQKLQTIK